MSLNWEQQEVFRKLKNAPGTMYQESNDTEKTIFRDWVRGVLQSQPVSLTFIKADGTERQMKCTLNWDYIPAKEHVKPVTESAQKPRKEPDPEVFRVYDLDKSEWRSFRIDRLKMIQVDINVS